MEKDLKEFESTLNSMNDILNDLSEKQTELRIVIKEKNWEKLINVISEINKISDYFSCVDEYRDEMQSLHSEDELKPFLPVLRDLRSKLLKCKVENKVLGEYVTITRQFIQEIVDEAVPVKGNRNYSRTGKMTQPQLQSVLVDLRG